jgi:hypothetical protein
MREPIETIMYRNSEIAIYQDEDAHSPNDWDNDYAFLLHDHRDFATHPHLKGIDRNTCQEIYDTRWSEGKKTYYYAGKNFWIIPVFAYIHSGVSLYLNRRAAMQYEPTGFDTSFKGFVLVDKTKPEMWAMDDAFKVAESVIKEWNMYLSGEVYGYQSASGSCWGFYGEEGKKEMIEEAKSEIDWDCKDKLLKKIAKVKIFIRNNVPLEIRERIIPIVN